MMLDDTRVSARLETMLSLGIPRLEMMLSLGIPRCRWSGRRGRARRSSPVAPTSHVAVRSNGVWILFHGVQVDILAKVL